ncbi:hypothetical protein MKX01_014551 [Papaver californicum]|nr:hypothetical protein MKX01_014551 [Papaver californicum]
MILNCKKNSNVKNYWREIAAALPWRPYLSVYKRAHLLFERAESRNWTEDEKACILKFHEKHGPDYKTMANQAEYQILFDLVNKDLRMCAYEERKSKYGLLRDNIGWQAISHTLATRTDVSCCYKWYTKLSSSMVKEGIWADVDDYQLLNELFKLDACCVGDRWRQMVNHIGEHGIKSFTQQVEVLAKRYCPELLETREAFDSMP